MIYIFKGIDNRCSQVFDTNGLSEEVKAQAVAIVDKVPMHTCSFLNETPVLMYDPDKDELYWNCIPELDEE